MSFYFVLKYLHVMGGAVLLGTGIGIALSIVLYIVTGMFWLPVVWMQMRMRDLAQKAVLDGVPLPLRYRRLFCCWFAFGFPAFGAVLAIFWLMIAKPAIAILLAILTKL